VLDLDNYESCKQVILSVISIPNKIHFKVYFVFWSLNFQQHVSAAIMTVFRVVLLLLLLLLLLLQEYKVTMWLGVPSLHNN